MACSGGHCSYHSTGLTTCAGHQLACATNRPITLSAGFGIDGYPVLASDVEALRIAIAGELTRWAPHQKGKAAAALPKPAAVARGDAITNEEWNALTAPVDLLLGVAAGTNIISAGTNELTDASDPSVPVITNSTWAGLKARYDQLRINCVCHADCACNAVCACHNDCGCHYSDERLKKDIVYC